MEEYKNRFEKSLARVMEYIGDIGDWRDEDCEHFVAITDALRIASEIEEKKPKVLYFIKTSIGTPQVNENGDVYAWTSKELAQTELQKMIKFLDENGYGDWGHTVSVMDFEPLKDGYFYTNKRYVIVDGGIL